MRMQPQLQILLAMVVAMAIQLPIQAALSPAESDEFNGQEAPAFSVTTVKGNAVSLKDFEGHPVLVNFFASWCPPCRSEIGQLTHLYKQRSKQGVAVIGFAVDSVETPDTVGDVKPLAEKLAIPYPVAIATEKITKDYHNQGIPTTILIDKDGKIAKTFYGYHDQKAFDELLQRLLSESKPAAGKAEAPSKPSTK
jgi:cytochrome c biogenesis protein CcmG/thiol:disulfide interchange protein DsbE